MSLKFVFRLVGIFPVFRRQVFCDTFDQTILRLVVLRRLEFVLVTVGFTILCLLPSTIYMKLIGMTILDAIAADNV
jgi:hypothetical protein